MKRSPLPPPPHVPEAQVRRLSLAMSRRLDGMLQGDHARAVLGPGSELAEARPYAAGDDARRIDWAVTARTGETHVRSTTADRELETHLVVDLTPSMAFGSRRSEKRDLALAVACGLVHLTSSHGDRVGALVLTADGVHRVPARAGRDAAHALRHVLLRTPRVEASRERGEVRTVEPGDRPVGLAAALTQLARPPRRRGLVVLLSDLIGPDDPSGAPAWARPLGLLAQRCDVVVGHVQDPWETELPDVGTLHAVDLETGRQLEVRTTPELRRRYATAAAARTTRHRDAVRAAGAAHVLLRTDRDWLPELAHHLTVRRTVGAPARGALRV